MTRSGIARSAAPPGPTQAPVPASGSADLRSLLVGPGDLEHWRHWIGTLAVPLEPVLWDDTRFRAHLDITSAGPLSLMSVRGRCHGVVRSAQAARQAAEPFVKITYQVAGSGVLAQDGRECLLHPGDMAVFDTTRPYSQSYREDFEIAVLIVPRHALSLPEHHLGRFTASVLPSDRGAGAVLSACMRSLHLHLRECQDVAGHPLAVGCMDLLAATVTELVDDSTTTPPEARRRQILAWIQAHLADEELSPATVATAHHISPRYLHRLFEDEGISIAAYIRRQRLRMLRQDLANPLLVDRSIGVLAARWGFQNQPHVTRLFRDEFGMTPGDARRRGDRLG